MLELQCLSSPRGGITQGHHPHHFLIEGNCISLLDGDLGRTASSAQAALEYETVALEPRQLPLQISDRSGRLFCSCSCVASVTFAVCELVLDLPSVMPHDR